ncbi:MAG: tetratricopeptide repeat protein [Gammaproteobacteria bacterium]|nr:tetratricopeptide repeat protein [Gammaproteobacteria bacterium]MDH3859600.1 tetratricopeptide repeat protein [Gammaproteobacteria bacterium]
MLRFLLIFLCLLATAAASAATSIQQLQQLLEQQQYTDAADTGEQLLAQNPQHARARFLTAYAYQMSAQPEKAEMLYQDLIKDNPNLPEPRNNLAMIYLAKGDYDRASQLLVEALNTSPSYATAYDNLSQIYKGIASEAYRRAVSESSEPAKYTHNIQLTALTNLDSVDEEPVTDKIPDDQTLINLANQETRLIERVKNWAKAWSGKDFATYTDFYSADYHADFKSHDQWIEQRRKRISRPGKIKVEIENIQVKWRSENKAIIDFKQAYDSVRYSDRVVKRLAFSRIGSQWKITEERVLSVL